MSEVEDFLRDNASSGDGEDYTSVYLGAVGRKIVGKIVGTPRTADTKFGPRLVADVVVQEGTNCLKGHQGADGEAVIGETLSLWIKPGNQTAAVRDACQEAGTTGIGDGGVLAVAIIDQQDVGKGNPLNVHRAQYKPAVATVPVGEDLI